MAPGYTLVELVMVITIVSMVALVPASIMLESIKVYARVAPSLDADYQVRLAARSLKRDIRELADDTLIEFYSSSAFRFTYIEGHKAGYVLSGGELRRNGDLLAQGVTEMVVSVQARGGAVAYSLAQIALVVVDLTVQTGDAPRRVRFSVCPGFARYITAAPASPAEGGLA